MPCNPERIYKDAGWQSWAHWLGTAEAPSPGARPSGFLPFVEALDFAQSLKLGVRQEWEEWCGSGERPTDVPSNPHHMYASMGWQGWAHWLGTGTEREKSFLDFDEALPVARSLGLTGEADWRVRAT